MGDRVPYVEPIVTRAGRACEEARRLAGAPCGGTARRKVGTIYLVGGGVTGVPVLPGVRPVSIGGDAAGGCSLLGLSPILPF